MRPMNHPIKHPQDSADDARLRALLRGAPVPEPPPGFADRVMRRHRAEQNAPGWRERWAAAWEAFDWRPRPVALAAPALALVMVGLLLVGRERHTAPVQPPRYTQEEIFSGFEALAVYQEGVELWNFDW